MVLTGENNTDRRKLLRWVLCSIAAIGVVYVAGSFVQETLACSIGSCAGTYYVEDVEDVNLPHVHGRSLVISPSGDFTMKNFGRSGELGGHSGKVTMRGRDRVQFQPTEANYHPWEASLIRWGERCYLINDRHLDSFRNLINTRDEPRTSAKGYFYMRWGDWNKPVAGYPDIPTP